MKRFLLMMICAITVVAANAQRSAEKFNVPTIKAGKMVKGQTLKHSNNIPMELNVPNMKVVENLKSLPTQAKHKVAASAATVDGNWVEEHTKWADEMTSFTVASQVSVAMDEDEEGPYLEITGALEGYAEVLYAYYNEETGLYDIYPQYCYEHETYGKFAFIGLTEQGDLDFDNPYSLELSKAEDGHLTLTSTSENGWVILLMEGDYQGQAWNFGDDMILNKANFEFTGSEKHVANSAWTSWADVEGEFVCVETIDDLAIVHGMFGTSIMLEMNGNDFSLPNGQAISAGWTSNTDFFTFSTYNCGVDEEGYLTVPMAKDGSCDADPENSLPGYISTSGAYVFGTPTEDGKVDWDYIYIARFTSEEGYGYFKNLWAAIVLIPLEEAEPEPEPEPIDPSKADVNGDGTVDASDIQVILNVIAGAE